MISMRNWAVRLIAMGGLGALIPACGSSHGGLILPSEAPLSLQSGDQLKPRIIEDGSGGAIVVWEDHRAATTQLYAQRIDGLGAMQWALDGVAVCPTGAHQFSPVIVSDGSGGAIIVWEDYRNATVDIYAQRLNDAGVPQWTAGGVALCLAAQFQGLPQIISDGAGGGIVAWHDFRGTDSDVYAQRVSSGGVVQWSADGVVISAASNAQDTPQIATDGSGGAVIMWRDFRNASVDIYAQKVNNSGVVQWAVDGQAICTAVGDQAFGGIASDGTGGAIMAWNDGRSGGGSNDIFTQRVNSGGAVQWTLDGLPVSGATRERATPMILSDGSGGAIIVWSEHLGAMAAAFMQRVSGTGAMQWTADGLPLCSVNADQFVGDLVSDGVGGVIIVWLDFRGGSSGDLYAQRVAGSGALQWTAGGVAVCTAAFDQGDVRLASNGSSGAILAWCDFRNGIDNDLFTRQVRSSGQ